MRIEKIHIQNFRGIEDLEFNLNQNFNLLIGENGSGKTAILEALTVGMGAFFLGIPGISSRNIRDEDIRYFRTIEESVEFAEKTSIWVEGEVSSKKIEWLKERSGISGKTLNGNKNLIKSISQDINKKIRDPQRKEYIDLPVLAYYSTSRLWKEGRENEKTDESAVKHIPSRYRGYKDALQAKSTFSIMLDWFRSKFLSVASKGETSFQLECVKKAIISNIQGATNVYWEFDKDKVNALHIKFKDHTDLPFNYLSDGYRNLLAIFADLAWRCVTLNPHFKEDANLKSTGIVLIDEIDLHLHPAWQQEIVKKLKVTFPKIQFVATSHSPFVIQEMEDKEVFIIDSLGKSINNLPSTNRFGIEDIAEEIQNVETPNMSSKREEMFKAAEDYYQLLDSSAKEKDEAKLQELKDELDSIMERYSDDVAYYAFLKQERIARGIK